MVNIVQLTRYEKFMEHMGWCLCEYAFRLDGCGDKPLPWWHAPEWFAAKIDAVADDDTINGPSLLFSILYDTGRWFYHRAYTRM